MYLGRIPVDLQQADGIRDRAPWPALPSALITEAASPGVVPAQLLELVRYIHLNPLRAGLTDNLDALDS